MCVPYRETARGSVSWLTSRSPLSRSWKLTSCSACASRTWCARPVRVPSTVADAAGLWQAIQDWPALVIVDLRSAPGWQDVVRRAKSLPHFRTIPIVAFGSHVDIESLAAARAAGCDHAWARSRFLDELPELVEQALHPPLRELSGCDEAPPPLLLKGLEQFNAGEYWECHETLETLWRAEPRAVRDLYQGILQIGVAFHHLRERNYPGVLKLLRRGLPRLRGLPAVCQGVPVTELENAALAVHEQVLALGSGSTRPVRSQCSPSPRHGIIRPGFFSPTVPHT